MSTFPKNTLKFFKNDDQSQQWIAENRNKDDKYWYPLPSSIVTELEEQYDETLPDISFVEFVENQIEQKYITGEQLNDELERSKLWTYRKLVVPLSALLGLIILILMILIWRENRKKTAKTKT